MVSTDALSTYLLATVRGVTAANLEDPVSGQAIGNFFYANAIPFSRQNSEKKRPQLIFLELKNTIRGQKKCFLDAMEIPWCRRSHLGATCKKSKKSRFLTFWPSPATLDPGVAVWTFGAVLGVVWQS